jgi:phosphopantetheinyl transferase
MKSSDIKVGDVIVVTLKNGHRVVYDIYEVSERAVMLAYLDREYFFKCWCPRKALVKLALDGKKNVVEAQFAEWARSNNELVSWVRESMQFNSYDKTA